MTTKLYQQSLGLLHPTWIGTAPKHYAEVEQLETYWKVRVVSPKEVKGKKLLAQEAVTQYLKEFFEDEIEWVGRTSVISSHKKLIA